MSLSTLARPPITQEEAERADHSICPYHGGRPGAGWFRDGRVFFCPIGRQYWRYSSNSGNGMYSPLAYEKFGGI